MSLLQKEGVGVAGCKWKRINAPEKDASLIKADCNHSDRPRLDFVVYFDDHTSKRYHPKVKDHLLEIAIRKRRDRYSHLMHRYGTPWPH